MQKKLVKVGANDVGELVHQDADGNIKQVVENTEYNPGKKANNTAKVYVNGTISTVGALKTGDVVEFDGFPVVNVFVTR